MIDGALNLLTWASERFILALVTRGEERLQQKKIEKYSFGTYFKIIKIVKEKKDSDFLSIVNSFNHAIADTWIIGDSLKAEIESGLKIGAKCIFYDYKHTSYNWIQERNYKLLSNKTFFTVKFLNEIPPILEKIEYI